MQLRIDEHLQNMSTIWVHHQSEPHPGGHQYELILSRDEAKAILDEPPAMRAEDLNDKGRQILWLIGFEFFRSASEFEFVLNTVEKLEINDEGVKVMGICSPFIRH